jgi:hypothetical protein
MRFLLEGYIISNTLEIWEHVPWKNFHNGGIVLDYNSPKNVCFEIIETNAWRS